MAKSKESKETKQTTAEILKALEAKYGLKRPSLKDLTIISTGSIQLNQAMDIGGTALGKMIEIFGEESTGKTTITLHQLAQYQKAFPDRKVALFDYEHSFNKELAANVGLNVDDMLLYQPDTQEMGYDMILALIEKGIVSCIVVDSQTAALPKAVLDGEMSDSTIGLQARLNSKFCQKVRGLMSINNTSLFLVSQTRNTIGGMGDPNITTGGKAIKFYSDARWKLWKTNDKANGLIKVTIDVVKSKLGKPFNTAKVDIVCGYGFDRAGEVVDYGVEFGIIKINGSWFSYGEIKLGQGRENVKELLKDNPELLDELTKKVMDKLNEKNRKEEEEIIVEEPAETLYNNLSVQ